ncbi:hypothetical protein PC110_g17616 [Phytophthora cactorum]|uniref:Uncharacterized protein n=1 Tax=Phytophthora cactorum TaxID=29920 RepID=A0A329RNR3_9STRA|nr:hypothetical protein PC110_g17616 [Phytophthora cactorum]
MDLAVLYERILALVPVDDLHDSYNGVLHEELSSINRAVNDVSAAFAKLEEVHEAVNKLSNGSTGTRSVTLTEAMNSTMQLQRELKKKLESTIATMTKFCGKRKRAEKNANRNGPKAAKAEIKSEDLVRVTRHEEKKTNGEEAEPKTEDDFEMSSVSSGGDKARNSPWVSGMTQANCLERLRMMTQLSVGERSNYLSGVVGKVTDIVPVYKETKQISILTYVLLWANLSAGHPGDFAAYDCFSKDMAAVINQGPQNGGTVALRRLNDSLLALLRDQKDSRDSQTKTNGGSHLPFDLLVWRVNAMAATDRRKHLQQVVDSLKQAMSRDASGRKEGVTSVNKKRQRNEQVERITHTQRDNEESESESSSESSSDSSESSGESEEEAIAVDPRRRFLLQQTREDEKNDGDCSGALFPGRSTLISDLEIENIAGARPSRRFNLLPPTNSREKSSCVVNKTDSGGQSNVVTVAKTSKQYMNMVEKVDRMSAVERYSHIREVLEEMTRVVNNFGRARLQEQEAQIIMEYVLRWLWDCTDQRDLLDVYQSFLTAMVAYEKQAELKETSMLKGLNTKFSRILEQLEFSKGEPTGSNLEKSKSKHGKSMHS